MDLKIKDVSDLLNVSETTIRRWLAEGKIPAYRLNHQYRFSRIEIENWMLSCKVKHPTEFPFKEEQIYPPLPSMEDESPAQRSGIQQFSLYRAIHRGNVFSHSGGDTKEDIIRETMQLSAPQLGLDADVLTELLLDREELMPTALNHGVAVPHPRDFLLQAPFDMVFVVFPKHPLEYGALDGKPVHTLFFLFSCEDKRHLHLLAKIAHFSSNQEALAFLRTRPEKDKLLEYIRTWESDLG